MEEMKAEKWLKLGEKLYGKDKKKWKFKCVKCGHIQTAQDFIDIKLNPNLYVNFSCIGRWKKGTGCDWTLGGLFRFHKREIIYTNGEKGATFLFANE